MTEIKPFKNGKYFLWVDFWNKKIEALLSSCYSCVWILKEAFRLFTRHDLTMKRWQSVGFHRFWQQLTPDIVRLLHLLFCCSRDKKKPFGLQAWIVLWPWVEMIGFALKGGRKPPLTTNQSRSPLSNPTSQIEHLKTYLNLFCVSIWWRPQKWTGRPIKSYNSKDNWTSLLSIALKAIKSGLFTASWEHFEVSCWCNRAKPLTSHINILWWAVEWGNGAC